MSVKNSGASRKTPSTGKSRGQKNVTPITGRASKTTTGQLPLTHVHPELVDEIRIQAYAIYEGRGRQDGLDLDDWFRAEEEILSRYQKEKSA